MTMMMMMITALCWTTWLLATLAREQDGDRTENVWNLML